MTPICAEELLNLIMLDDFVDRRKALDVWVKRWHAELVVTVNEENLTMPWARKELLERQRRATILDKMLEGLFADPVGGAISIEEHGSIIRGRLALMLQIPKDVP